MAAVLYNVEEDARQALLALPASGQMAGPSTSIDAFGGLRGTPADGPSPEARRHSHVAFHSLRADSHARCHDVATKRSVAASLARLLGLDFAATGAGNGDRATSIAAAAGAYLVPSDTLLSLEQAHLLGVHGPDDLFGGVVPHPFVATKVITHALVRSDARAPEGWSREFSDRVRPVVLPGYSAFSAADARRAVRQLLGDGAVRVKEASGVGGLGQTVVSDMTQFETLLATIDPAVLERDGVVLERNLGKVETYSVGQVTVGGLRVSYCGTQGLTHNHAGVEVYGGSSLTLVRGDFEALLTLRLTREVRTAVEQALTYHRAALACYAGMFASRCNYDVAQGLDETGRWRSGVLEQSWRIGGASGAELAALHAFHADPALQRVDASTHEVYADDPVPPPGAQVHFDGVDPHVGRLLKYARLETHGHI